MEESKHRRSHGTHCGGYRRARAGLGRAISKALKEAGYRVAANYAGNDEAANKFKAETGIPVYKWDVQLTRPARPA